MTFRRQIDPHQDVLNVALEIAHKKYDETLNQTYAENLNRITK